MEKYGFELLGTHWVKKVSTRPNIYELRISVKNEIRVLFGCYQNVFVILHIYVKKSNKLPIKEKQLAIQRFKQFTS